MALAPIPWNPGRKTLAEFSEAWLFAFGMIATPLALGRGHPRWALAFWVIAVLGRGIGLVHPTALRPIFLAMLLTGWPLGWVISNLTLLGVYLVTVTPIGLWVRVRRGDPLKRLRTPEADSYWEPIRATRSSADYLRPF